MVLAAEETIAISNKRRFKYTAFLKNGVDVYFAESQPHNGLTKLIDAEVDGVMYEHILVDMRDIMATGVQKVALK